MDPTVTDLPDIERWILLYLAVLGGTPVEGLDAEAPLAGHDLDSVDAVQMAIELEKIYGFEVEPELFMQGEQSAREIAEMLRPVIAASR